MIGFNHIDIALGDSNLLYWIFLSFHLSAVSALLISGLTFLMMLVLVLCVFVSFHIFLREYLLTSRAITRLVLVPSDHLWSFIDEKGEEIPIVAIKHATVLKWLLVMRFCDPLGKCHWLVIPKDSIDAESFRRLSVVLLYQLPE